MSGKRQFWEDFEDVVGSVHANEKLFIGGDLTGHVRTTNLGFEGVLETSDMATQTRRVNTS
jgi:hypothetical protein